MSLTILSSRYGNAEHTAAVLETAEFGSVARSVADSTPADWAEAVASKPAAYVAPVIVKEDPVAKLRDFLATNPEVATLLSQPAKK